MEHGLLASHACEFATPDLRETQCFELNEPRNERTPPRSSDDARRARHEPKAGAALGE